MTAARRQFIQQQPAMMCQGDLTRERHLAVPISPTSEMVWGGAQGECVVTTAVHARGIEARSTLAFPRSTVFHAVVHHLVGLGQRLFSKTHGSRQGEPSGDLRSLPAHFIQCAEGLLPTRVLLAHLGFHQLPRGVSHHLIENIPRGTL